MKNDKWGERQTRRKIEENKNCYKGVGERGATQITWEENGKRDEVQRQGKAGAMGWRTFKQGNGKQRIIALPLQTEDKTIETGL